MPSVESLSAERAIPATRLACSHELGWTDVLARTYDEPDEAAFTTTPTQDLLVVLQTSGTCRLESRQGRRWVSASFRPGSMGANAPHTSAQLRWRRTEQQPAATPTRTLHVHLGADLLVRTADALGRPAAVRTLPDDLVLDDPGVRATARAVGVALAGGAGPLAGDALGQALAVQVLGRIGSGGTTRTPGGASALTAAEVSRLDEHMRAHLAGPVRLQELAALVHTSTHHFVRRFRAATGTTPHRELVRLRVEHAARLLRTSDLDVPQVARACGYASAAHFGDAFRRHHGATPGAYRRAHRG